MKKTYKHTQFLSTPSARRATKDNEAAIAAIKFLSTPSARRATDRAAGRVAYLRISIHALREEGDLILWKSADGVTDFYPRPPRGGRRGYSRKKTFSGQFLSTPSARRATGLCAALPVHERAISIHALREEGDRHPVRENDRDREISIHALREEGDNPSKSCKLPTTNFYPRPPRGGRRR